MNELNNTLEKREAHPSPPNLPPGNSFSGKIRFFCRGILDLQVSSVRRLIKPWLSNCSGQFLEVGCGAQPYRYLLPSECCYTGLDWEGAESYFAYNSAETVYYAGEKFPFENLFFDAVFHTEVIEHVENYQQFLLECHRVLKDKGQMCFSVPFSARYHYQPYDYWRFTPAGKRKILADADFHVIHIYPRGNDITVASYKIISIIYRWLRGEFPAKLLAVFLTPIFIAALTIGHFSLRLPWMGSLDDTLGYVVLAEKA